MPSFYRGRFAPSPTGLLHFGSLVAAVGSYADARANAGQWHLRIDDLDSTRVRPNFEQRLQIAIKAYGMRWDGEVIYQSKTLAAYQSALCQLQAQGLTYVCGCSRSQVKATSYQGPQGPIYAGTCRDRSLTDDLGRAIRMRVGSGEMVFTDRVFGRQHQNLTESIGDFVVRRADGLYAYQLAVVVDDALAGITHVVRGADLLNSTPRQIGLQKALGYPQPSYLHLPLATASNGRKLSKREDAAPLNELDPLPDLRRAWHFLNQVPVPSYIHTPKEFWAWAPPNWQPQRIPQRGAIEV